MPLAPGARARAGAALLAALLAATATAAPPCKSTGAADDVVAPAGDTNNRNGKSLGVGGGGGGEAGCLFEGLWHREGAVAAREACLQCACAAGALRCRRRACRALPDPPPPRCHVVHRRGACCPDLHCPDGITIMEQEASARSESEDDIIASSSLSHACVEGGTVYAAGSAMRSALACEQCFCLGGARRCVRPRCLPPPPGCRAPPAAGACCPHRYYCEHKPDKPPQDKHPHDCRVDGAWVPEGERVSSAAAAGAGNCSACFCLRGAVRCQPLSCAPPLLGCTPLLRAGECCAHQYHCQHHQHGSQMLTLTSNALSSTRTDDRAFHSSKSKKYETTTKNTLAKIYTAISTPKGTAKNHLVSTTKVKRKTSDPPPEISSAPATQTTTTVSQPPSTTTVDPVTTEPTTMAKLITTTPTVEKLISTTTSYSTTEVTTEMTSTEQPEGSVRIMVNGTINCTAEFSSTSLPLNMTLNDTEQINLESKPRVPLIDVSNLEDHTFSANDIITDRTVSGGFDENESFVINVTSSLNTNTNHTSARPPLHTAAASVPALSAPVTETNSSKKTKGDYDFDYTEPTLPPSLPNLKIIPFVAADAVFEDDNPKETLTYPMLEREDKFPVYYPSADNKESGYLTRGEDAYRSTQYPVFITDKPESEYPSLTPEVDLTNTGYSNINTAVASPVNEYTAAASLGDRVPDVKPATLPPLPTTTYKLETPAVNLFSPPIETEGGFVPKGPTGLIEEYLAVFPSTPPGPAMPHLTTSMQLDVIKDECLSGDGRHVREGESIILACSECTCAWGELHCSPRACPTPRGCTRRPPRASAADICCGELVCHEDNKTTPAPEVTTAKVKVTEINTLQTTTETIDETKKLTKINEASANNTVTIDVPRRNEENVSQIQTTTGHSFEAQTDKNNNETTSTATERLTTQAIMTTTTTAGPIYKTTTPHSNHSLEYEEEEEEEDDGFSFGSVLKLLLSDNYETTTTPPKKILTTTKLVPPARTSPTTRRPRPTLPPALPPKPTIAPFVPLPVHSYVPSNQNSINRIDHLVLGEATAIKKTTPARTITTTFRPATTIRSTSRPTTPRIVSNPTVLTIEGSYSMQDAPRPPGGPGLGPGLLKLAGCNIYGRMYRVGRIITELSTPCQECWCTEIGVQCKQLIC